jgi:hypothetical protein
MPFEKVEFSFPGNKNDRKAEVVDNDDTDLSIEVEPSSALEVEKPTRTKNKATGNDEQDQDETAEVTDDTDGFSIEVVDDTPRADRNRKASDPPDALTDEELGEYSEKVRKRIKHFSKGYHDERRAKETALRERQELERYAQQLIEENKTLKGAVGKNQTALLEQAKKAVETELAQAKKAYKDAYEAGDSEGVLTAQENLTSARLKADKLNDVRIPATTEESSVKPAPTTVDPRAAEWAKANTWFGTDDEMTSYALGLHNKLVKSGINPQSDEYYETINSRMRTVFPESFGEEPKETKNTVEDRRVSRRQATVVAPATRSTTPKKVTLTQTQVNLAKRLGVSLKDYAEQVALEMRKQNGR